MSKLILLGVGAMLSALLLSCGDDGANDAPEGAIRGEVVVFAAASLTEAFSEIEELFEAEHPGVDVVFNFGGTPTLRTQLEQGARADVFASANLEQMELARQNGVVEAEMTTFARNSLVIITPAENPASIETPADLGREGLKLVVANEDVPAGAYTRQMLATMEESGEFEHGFAGAVLDNVVSLESNVKQIVAKVELGEADAGVVYGTDVTPAVAPRVRSVAVPEQYNVIAAYPAAVVREAENGAGARAFIEFLLSDAAQAVLARYGFLAAA